MKIAHISDLHLGGGNFVEEWGENLVKKLNEIGADVIVITGDLTDDGYLDEYKMVEEFLSRIKGKKLIVPGNHDARNKGYEIFEEIFGTRYPVYENETAIILGMDSSQPDIDEGHIGRENYHRMERMEGKKIKIMALHHHIIPIPGTGRERNILIDAGDVLQLCIKHGINFVLSGHKHLPWIWKLENTYFITAGTACSRRLKGKSYPSFNTLEIDGGVNMREINVEDLSERVIISYGAIP